MRLVVYCASGGRSALAAKTLKDMGIENVANMLGGFTAWQQNGGPIER
jgi:rhodanese-related sulfurtransferase